MATKSAQQEPEKAEVVEELLDALDTALDRVKVLYEQYFLGIQKQPPSYLHTDVERKIRDITQLHVRNTALRYRFATLQQKFGAYNAYWRRTLRQIENGTYTRNLSKIGRQAARTGAAVPEEILAAMPKRMRAQVERDREAALALARLRDQQRPGDPELLTLTDEDVDIDLAELEPAAVIRESTDVRRKVLRVRGPYTLADADCNLDGFFAAMTGGDEPELDAVTPVVMWRPSNVPALAPPPTQGVVRAVMPAPSQATRPSPVAPGASAVYAPAAVETLAGPFPRIPSLPALPSKQRPGTGASPVGVEPREELVPASPVVAVERARVSRPPPRLPRPTAGQAAQPGRAGPSAERTPVPDRLPPQERTPAPERLPPTERTPAPERLPSTERTPAPDRLPPGERTPAPERLPPGERTTAPEHLPPGERAPAPERLSPSERTPVPERAPPSERSAAQRPTAQRPTPRRGVPRSHQGPPPGMTNSDVNALYAAYVKAKQALGEDAGPSAYAKLLKTINAQAPKIMEQYKAKRVDFSVVVRDNQVIIRAKPRP